MTYASRSATRASPSSSRFQVEPGPGGFSPSMPPQRVAIPSFADQRLFSPPTARLLPCPTITEPSRERASVSADRSSSPSRQRTSTTPASAASSDASRASRRSSPGSVPADAGAPGSATTAPNSSPRPIAARPSLVVIAMASAPETGDADRREVAHDVLVDRRARRVGVGERRDRGLHLVALRDRGDTDDDHHRRGRTGDRELPGRAALLRTARRGEVDDFLVAEHAPPEHGRGVHGRQRAQG